MSMTNNKEKSMNELNEMDKIYGSGVQVVIFAVRLLTVKGVYL